MILKYTEEYSTNHYLNLSQVIQAYTVYSGINMWLTDGNSVLIRLDKEFRELGDIILDRLSEFDWNASGMITLSELIPKE